MTARSTTTDGCLFIGGEFRPASDGATLETFNPATGESLGTVAAAQEADIDDAVAAATDARGQGWGSRRPKDRGRILWRIGELIRERAEFLAQLDCADAGRLLRHAMAADVVRAAEMFEFYAGLADKIRGSTYQSDFESLAYSLREPYGVVAAIIPWNSPLVSAAGKSHPHSRVVTPLYSNRPNRHPFHLWSWLRYQWKQACLQEHSTSSPGLEQPRVLPSYDTPGSIRSHSLEEPAQVGRSSKTRRKR